MKPFECTRIYHPSLGKFVYKHKGSGIIVDNIFKPGRSIASSLTKSVVKPLAKKASQSGSERLGTRLGQKSGDFIMQKLQKKLGKQSKIAPKQPVQRQQESSDDIINRLISGTKIM